MHKVEKRMISSIIASATIFNYGICKSDSFNSLIGKLQMYSYSTKKKVAYTFGKNNTIDLLIIGGHIFIYNYEREEFLWNKN